MGGARGNSGIGDCMFDDMTTTDIYNRISNVCECDWSLASSCSCYDDDVDNFYYEVKDWFEGNDAREWQVNGLPLWGGDVSGWFTAHHFHDFVQGITVRSEWTLRYRLNGDTLECILSHHDVPTGRSYTVTYFEGE